MILAIYELCGDDGGVFWRPRAMEHFADDADDDDGDAFPLLLSLTPFASVFFDLFVFSHLLALPFEHFRLFFGALSFLPTASSRLCRSHQVLRIILPPLHSFKADWRCTIEAGSFRQIVLVNLPFRRLIERGERC